MLFFHTTLDSKIIYSRGVKSVCLKWGCESHEGETAHLSDQHCAPCASRGPFTPKGIQCLTKGSLGKWCFSLFLLSFFKSNWPTFTNWPKSYYKHYIWLFLRNSIATERKQKNHISEFKLQRTGDLNILDKELANISIPHHYVLIQRMHRWLSFASY